jgi:hypothetical protein
MTDPVVSAISFDSIHGGMKVGSAVRASDNPSTRIILTVDIFRTASIFRILAKTGLNYFLR